MEKICKQCGFEFGISDRDLAFYDRVSPVFRGVKYNVPAPNMCPGCRQISRMSFRNQSSLYRRKSDKSGKDMIAMYREDAPFPVWSYDEWMEDDWDAKDCGRDFDFSRPFFEQFKELWNEVPQMGLVFEGNENCDFCNIVGFSKNCYLIYGSINCEDCLYGNPYGCIKCVDSYLLRNSELCLECTDSNKLYSCYKCQNCSNSVDLMFCFDVNNSQNCFGCAGLNRKQYCIYNEQKTKDEYENFIMNLDLRDGTVFAEAMKRFEEVKMSTVRRFYVGTNNERVSGDYIFNSKDCYDVYGVEDCQDVSHAFQMYKMTDCQEMTVGENGELNYFLSAVSDRVSNCAFCMFLWSNVHDLLYCGYCTKNVNNCFGSVGLKNAKYCILNKQYTKEEYEEMVPRIIEHMKSTGEWGRFFPRELSPFEYEETVASEFAPKKDPVDRPFKILEQEKKMYERFKVPLPTKSSHIRHLERLALRNPIMLFDRKCDKCRVDLESTYSPSRPEKVYCEECYRKEIY